MLCCAVCAGVSSLRCGAMQGMAVRLDVHLPAVLRSVGGPSLRAGLPWRSCDLPVEAFGCCGTLDDPAGAAISTEDPRLSADLHCNCAPSILIQAAAPHEDGHMMMLL